MSIEKMQLIEHAFTDAYNHTLSHFPDSIRRDVIKKYIAGITMQYSMYMAFSSDGLQRMIRDMFENEVVRDFVFRLTSSFYSRMGDDSNEMLVNVLTNSLCMLPPSASDSVNGSQPETLAIPSDIAQRLPTSSDVRDLLTNNKWLVTISMISLYLRIEAPEQKGPGKG